MLGAMLDGMTNTAMTTLLLSVRVAALLLCTPLLRAARVPGSAQLLLVFGLSMLVAQSLGIASTEELSTTGDLIDAVVMELVLGATLGLGVSVALAAFSLAGRMLDVQIGFGLAQVFDPGTNRQVSVLDSAFNHAAVLLFLLLQGHHALLRALAISVERFPPGSSWHLALAADAVFAQAAGLFSLGFALAAPVVFCVLLVELALGVLGRNLPQMNMFVLALPIKIAVGLVALSLWFLAIEGVTTNVFATIETTWTRLLPAPSLSMSRE